MSIVITTKGLIAPPQTFKFTPCQCKRQADVMTETDRDDFLYDRCMVCNRIIEDSIRPWDDED